MQSSEMLSEGSTRKRDRGKLVLATAAALMGLGCAKHPEDFESRSLAQVGGPTLNVYSDALNSKGILGASAALYIGDRVRVEAATQGFAALSNTGTGQTYIGTDARIGPVWSSGPVDVRDRVIVYGAVHASNVSRGNQVVIQGGVIGGSLGSKVDAYEPPKSIATVGGSISLEPGQSITLRPGSYDALSVKSNATLHLDVGPYSFSTVFIESGGKVYTKSDCEPVAVEVRTSLFFRGQVVEEGGDDPGVGLAVYFRGTAGAHVESAFRGAIFAPNAELTLNSATHRGHFFAKTLRVQAGAVIKEVADQAQVPGECGYAVASLPSPTPLDIGPAPPLASASDVDAFLGWFYLIAEAEKPAALERIQAVVPDSGVKDEVIARFETARGAGDRGRALMLLALLGALPDSSVESFLLDLLAQPLVGAPDPEGERTTPYNLEVSYRRQALFILNAKSSTAGRLAVHETALHHPEASLRSAAIWALSHGQSDEVVASLRSELSPEDRFYLDMPTRSAGNFEGNLSAFLSQYGN